MHARRLALVLATLPLVGCDDGPTQLDEQQQVAELLETVRTATAPWQSLDAAIAAGFEPASPCVASPAGGMGIHYGRMNLVDATVDASQPELLLYEPDTAGNVRLVAIEFLVTAADWDAANDAPPTLAGRAFDDHRAENARHGLPFPHYELHVWAWEDNSAGVFAPFNPAVACPPEAAPRHDHGMHGSVG